MICSHCGRTTSTASGRCTECGAVLEGNVLFDGATFSGATGLTSRPDEIRPSSGGAPDETRLATGGTSDETRLGIGAPAGPSPSDTGMSDGETRLAVGPVAGPRTDATAEPIAVGLPFGTRYQIIRQLGVGGMGAVYQAWDQELSVVVALKVIRPEVAANPEAARMLERRFKQELLLARQVTHKNVVRIHDLGEINGVKYITMPYVDGEDLSTILKREEKLPVRRVLKMARTMASGLAAAHTAGVVHRDLKPANIMIDADGEAMIMDFGIARSTGAVARSGDAVPRGGMPSIAGGHTLVGMIVGTVEYMAPEQAKAQEVDHRADIYAFGLILYDLLVGRARQTRAESALAELTSRTMAAPPSARSIDPKIPEPLDKIITRCIQPDAEARYKTTAELVADLDRLDADGNLLPIVRRLTRRMIAGVAALFVATLATTWWFARGPAVPVQHDPVSVVIADFQNNTGDMTFDRVLEPTLKRALEEASFINAYDRTGMGAFGVRPEKFDEATARDIALKQGLGVVLSGSLERQGNRYEISIKAIQSVTGDVLTTAKRRASNKDEILVAATKLVITVREALGDDTSDATRMYAVNTVSASSPEVMRHYVAAREVGANGNFEEARRHLLKAVEVDPKFGLGYQNLAAVSQNLGNLQDTEKYIEKAVSLLASMTERERYGVRALLYRIRGDYQACVKEYGELVGRYAADVNARNGLALCSTFLRDMPKAVDEMRQVVKILPKRALFRYNLALYESYAGNFQTGEQEARATVRLGYHQGGLLALAFAQLGQGQPRQAAETYQELANVNELGASQAASGLGDLAIVEGRFSDAVRILEKGAHADLASNNPDTAAAKFTSLAYAHLLLGQKRQAVAAAEKAHATSKAVKIRFLAARVFVEAGETPRALKVAADELASEPLAEPRTYAKILEAEAALKKGEPRQAIKALTEANSVLDTWIGHFDLGRAYFEAGLQGTSGTGLRALDDFTQADSEFDRCIKRRGEALSLFLDEEPTYGYFPSVYYYQGRVREELKIEGFADSYRAYLTIRGQSTEDRLLADARRRAGS